jgi:hypothetical protein
VFLKYFINAWEYYAYEKDEEIVGKYNHRSLDHRSCLEILSPEGGQKIQGFTSADQLHFVIVIFNDDVK